MKIIKAIPTNIITGALAAGKTSFIKTLLQLKPEHERWAILVNEFGEIGLDGSLLATSLSSHNKSSNAPQTVFVKEVPGGCMCCASGLPMQIALNQLLAKAKPHRLLIEPTGLGHPKELLDVFNSEYYRDVIKLNATVCLIDARNLERQKWREHQTFTDQLTVADLIVATKCDLYTPSHKALLKQYLIDTSLIQTPLHFMTNALDKVLIELMLLPSQFYQHKKHVNFSLFAQKRLEDYYESILASPRESRTEVDMVEEDLSRHQTDANGVKKTSNEVEGFYSRGWVWPADYWFDYNVLLGVLDALNVTRIKALMITTDGIFSFNGQFNELDVSEHDEAVESRLEFIAESEEAALGASSLIEQAFM